MKFLQKMLIEDEINRLYKVVEHLQTSFKLLTEGVTDFSPGSTLPDMLDEALKRLAAAKQGLSLANKLKTRDGKPDVAARSKHKSAIMGNLNKIRGLVARVSRSLELDLERMNQQLSTRPGTPQAGSVHSDFDRLGFGN